MSSSKKIDLRRDFAAGVYLSEAQNPLSPPHTLYTVNSKLIHTGKGRGGRVEPERRLDWDQLTKSWVENTNMTDCISSLLPAAKSFYR
jgi:hypothetical protein